MNLSELTPEQVEELEHLSDEIRKGHPVGIMDGMVVIEYQNALKKQRLANKKWWQFWIH